MKIEVQLVPIDASVVAAARSGQIAGVSAEEGQTVAANEVVAELDSRRAVLDLERAKTAYELASQKASSRIAIRLAEKTHDLAVTELGRAEAMNTRIADSVSGREIDALKLARDKSALAIEQAHEERSIAEMEAKQNRIACQLMRLDLEQHKLRAPNSGVVVEVHKRRGEWIEQGEAILEIKPVDLVHAEGFLPPEIAAMPLRDSPASLELQAPNGGSVRLEGKIVFVAPESNPVNRMSRFRAEFRRGGTGARPGMAGVVVFAPTEPADPPSGVSQHTHKP